MFRLIKQQQNRNRNRGHGSPEQGDRSSSGHAERVSSSFSRNPARFRETRLRDVSVRLRDGPNEADANCDPKLRAIRGEVQPVQQSYVSPLAVKRIEDGERTKLRRLVVGFCGVLLEPSQGFIVIPQDRPWH